MPAPKSLVYQNQRYVRADHFTDASRGTLKCPGAVFTTNGKGLWSRTVKPVRCLKLQVGAYDAEGSKVVAELRAIFDPKEWNTRKDGLIYTDNQWLKELRAYLVNKLQFSPRAAKDADYSEQGMQGDNYVSLDVGPAFLAEWDAHKPQK
jgi:hypothetical protein